MAEFRIGMHQHRNQVAKTLLQYRVAVDIHDIDGEGELAVQRSKRSEHLIAQVAMTASVENQPQHRLRALRDRHGLLVVQAFDGDKALVIAAAHMQGNDPGLVYRVQ